MLDTEVVGDVIPRSFVEAGKECESLGQQERGWLQYRGHRRQDLPLGPKANERVQRFHHVVPLGMLRPRCCAQWDTGLGSCEAMPAAVLPVFVHAVSIVASFFRCPPRNTF